MICRYVHASAALAVCRATFVATGLFLVLALPASAQRVKASQNALDDLTFQSKALSITSQGVDSSDFRQGAGASDLASAQPVLEGYDSLVATAGGQWRMVLDRVTGRPSLIEGEGIPWIPGAGNDLRFSSLGLSSPGASENDVPLAYMEKQARDLLQRYPGLFGVSAEDLTLMPGASGPVLDYLYFVDFQWTYHGIPVENAHVVFRVNNGNLVQFGEERICDSIERLDPLPSISKETAWEILWGYVGGAQPDDEVLDPGRMLVVPVLTSSASAGDLVPPGAGMEYRLVYVLDFRRPGVMGTWEARVDAHTGEILSFNDQNRYGHIQGGVYKTDRNPSQTEVTMPFPYANYGTGVYADAAGNFSGTSGTSTLVGKYVKIVDNCGSVSKASDGAGLIDFGVSSGTDCTTPGSGGAGNTHSSRTQYWNVTQIKMKAMTYLPTNTWLQGQLTDNVDLVQTCNAYWSGSSLNFFRSGGGCGNTGELPGVSLHEWGHGMDSNDGNGSSPDYGTGETYGDTSALLQTHQSCLGGGFFESLSRGCGLEPGGSGYNCSGYGNCCTSCSGVRDVDYMKHSSLTPATLTFAKACPTKPTYAGPCGKEGHCESYVSTEANWDLATRDLVSWGLDATSAWQLLDKLWYASRSTATAAFVCTVNSSCNTGNLFNVFRVVDDCDGNLANGTPHASAIWAAFSRHEIGCSTAVSTDNSCGCASLGTPVLSGTAGNNFTSLSWGAVSGATSYDVFRNEAGCDAGFTKIGNTTGTAYTDILAVNGITYYYRVQANGATGCPSSPMSNCATLTPAACTPPGAPAITSITDNDACAQSGIQVNYTAGSGATSHNLLKDGSVVVTGYTSGATYNPGDTSSHTYVVQAVNSTCTTNSTGSSFTDANGTPATPAAPTVSDVSPCAQTGVSISWDAVSGATGYDLQVDGGTVVTGVTSPYTYSPGNGNVHTYAIRAKTATCTGAWSSTTPGTDANNTPGAPAITGIADVNVCAQSGIQVSYTPGSGAASHNLLKDGAVVVTNYVSGATYNPGDGASHTYVVRAVNGTCTADSAGSAFSDAGSLGAPSITSITDNDACAQSGIKVNYTAGSGATSHNLLMDGSVVVTGYVSGATYNPGNTASHTYVVQAVSGSCTANSAGSSFADANNTPGAPVITSITDADACSQSGIKVSYTAGSGAASHNLLKDGSVVVTNYVSGATYNPGDGASHTYVVRAVNGTCATDSAGSSFADGNATPAAPASAGASASAYSSVSVTWATVTGATGYNVYRATGTCPQASYAKITGSPVVGPPYADNTVSGSTTYAYVVAALVGACESVQSPCAQATTPAAPCSTPPTFAGLTSVTPVSGATCSLQLAWSAATSNCGGAISYSIYRKSGSTPSVPGDLFQSGLTGTTYTDATVTSGTTYYYIVQALDSANGTSDGNTIAKSGAPGTPSTSTLFSNGIDNGWSSTQVTGTTGAWTFTTAGSNPTASPHGGTWMVTFNSYTATSGNQTRLYYAPSSFAIPGTATSATLSFWMYHDTGFSGYNDRIQAQLSTDGTTWTNVGSAVSRYSATNGWTQATIDVSAYKGSSVYIGFLATSAYGNNMFLDDVALMYNGGTSLDSDGFEVNWYMQTVNNPDNTAAWYIAASGTNPTASPHGGIEMAEYNSYTCASGDKMRLIWAPGGTLAGFAIPAGANSATLSFWMYHDTGYSTYDDTMQAQVTTDGSTWNNVGAPVHRYTGTNGWVQATADVTSYAGQTIGLGLLATSAFGNNMYIDDVSLTATTPGTCTSCAAPSSLANNSAADVSACAASGVQVAWTADAGNWGDGGGTRTYDVLRDGTPVQTGIPYGTTSVTTTPPDGLSHTYAVRYNNACGLSATTAGVAASDENNPSVPTITGSSSNTCPSSSVTLTTESGMTGYQWYLGGSPIAGATSNTYAAVLSGSYTVSYANASGCSGTSAPFPVTVAVCEVSPAADSAHALKVLKNGNNADIQFQDLGAAGYNVYVSTSPNTHPFAVASSTSGKKDCDLAAASISGGMRQVTGYTVESGITSGATVYYILVTADNGAATEGPMGDDSSGAARTADSYCNH